MNIVRFTETGGGWQDLNRDGTVSFVEKAAATAGATFLLGVGVWVLCQLAYVGLCGLLNVEAGDAWRFWRETWAWLTLLLVAGLGLVLYIWRMVTPEKSERLAKADLAHRWAMQELERLEKELQIARMQGVDEHEPGTRFSQGDVDAMAELMIRRYYEGKPWSRAELEKVGYPQDLWNRANQLLKARGIRHKSKAQLRPDTYDEAWRIFVEGKRKTPNQFDWRHDEKLETV